MGSYENALSTVWYGSCSAELGSFTINQLHVAADGSVDLLDLTFDRVCDGTWATKGHVVIGLPIPTRPRMRRSQARALSSQHYGSFAGLPRQRFPAR